jgi:hypothetical protein
MAKLKVTTPQTTDGTTLLYDENKQVVTKTNYMGLGARRVLESINSKLQPQLRHEIEVVEDDGSPVKSETKAAKNNKKASETNSDDSAEK